MKILFIMPSMDNGYWKKLGKKVGPRSEPMSLVYIASTLNHYGHNASILDCESEGLSLQDVEQHLKEGNFEMVGIAMLTVMYTQTLELAKLVKRINPNTNVVVGGPHPSTNAMQIIKEVPEIDIAVIGEAEFTFMDLVRAVEDKKSFADIKGIAYRNEKGEAVMTPEREMIQDLDSIPIPDRSLLRMHLYRPSVSYYKKLPAYIVLTSRGCPYRCTFCSKVFEKTYRYNSPERVIAEMKDLVENFGAKEIVFRDDTFTMKRSWTEEVCKKIIDEGLHEKIRWSCMTRVNLVTLDLLKLMKKAGCWGIHFGVESGNQRLLDLMKKDVTVEQIRNAFKWTREAGIETRAFMMIGLPTETREESLETIEFAKSLDPDWAQFTICTPYPGTEMFRQAIETGEMKSTEWDNYQTWGGFSDHSLVFVPQGRTSNELKNLQKYALRSFYFRPKVIARKITNIDNLPILRKYVTGAVALMAGVTERAAE